jgi:hypothetical protein
MTNKTEQEFNKLIGELTDEQFNSWVKTWFDEQIIMDIINEWDTDTKKEEIKNIKRNFLK